MRLDFHKNHRLLYAVVFFGFIALSVVVAVGPALWVQAHNEPLPGTEPLSDLEREGLGVYLAEGCAYCHTQQVRPLDQDTSRFGRASAPGDFARLDPTDIWRQTPAILGTERTGPDLSDVGTRKPSETWQYMHLYQPRSVVEASVMPAFHWLFSTSVGGGAADVEVPIPEPYAPASGRVVPTRRAQALVAYLMSRTQAPLPGQRAGTGAAAAPSGAARGDQVFSNHCASCHQENGQGVPGAFPPLAGNSVVTAQDPTEHIHVVLFGLQGRTIQGVSYSSQMPAWGDQLSNDQIAAVINHERTSWGNDAPTVTAPDVAAVRNEGGSDGGSR